MLDTREELIDRATVWTLDEGRRHLYDEINGRVSPAGHARDYVRKDMADFALNCERELIASIGYAIQHVEAVKDGDEDEKVKMEQESEKTWPVSSAEIDSVINGTHSHFKDIQERAAIKARLSMSEERWRYLIALCIEEDEIRGGD